MQHSGIQRSEPLQAVRVRVAIVHAACLGVFFVPAPPAVLWAALAGYFIRVFAWEVGGHRYFSHRAFRTSRAFQLLLAVLLAASGQRGPIWWAVRHREHHRHSDTERDAHSPVAHGFWQAHLGWLLRQETLDTDLDAAKDLSRWPELVWVNRWHYLFPLALLVLLFALGEWTSLFGRAGLGASVAVWVFFVGTALSLHASFAVNSLTHGMRPGFFNRRRYATGDTTTNAWWLALPTLGAGWHNNHHRYMNAARAGFWWWQVDPGWWALRLLAALGVVHDLHEVPAAVLAEGRAPR